MEKDDNSSTLIRTEPPLLMKMEPMGV